MLQVRDENHRPVKGVEIGDLGPKLGDAANDTGFLRINNVRISRDDMFAGHQSVTKEGLYVKNKKEKNDKLHYATMMFTRGSMTRQSGASLAIAATIATRYNLIRKQGFKDTNQNVSYLSDEFTLLDYQIQQYRIFKQISLSYAIKFTGNWLIDRFKELTGGDSNVTGQNNFEIKNVESLSEISSTTAGFKALATSMTSDGIEDLRKCCGGVGYLLSSGIAALAGDYVWRVTAEGDWIILMLQTARFIIKSAIGAKNGEKPVGPYSYLGKLSESTDITKFAPKAAKNVEDFLNLEYLEALFEYNALCQVSMSCDSYEKKLKETKNVDQTRNELQVELISTVKAHCHYFMIVRYISSIKEAKDKDIVEVLSNLCCLLGLCFIKENQWAGIIDSKQLSFVNSATSLLLKKLRPNASSLVDAFDIPDRVLNSAIGSSVGDVYEKLYEGAKKSELNLRDPFSGYEHIRDGLDKKFLKSKL
jgi:acyl-CoA oxidase